MAVKLRLTRTGKTGKASYRLVAIDRHKKRDGKAIEVLGHYNPHQPQNKIELKRDRLSYWLSVGAKPTKTVQQLIRKAPA